MTMKRSRFGKSRPPVRLPVEAPRVRTQERTQIDFPLDDVPQTPSHVAQTPGHPGWKGAGTVYQLPSAIRRTDRRPRIRCSLRASRRNSLRPARRTSRPPRRFGPPSRQLPRLLRNRRPRHRLCRSRCLHGKRRTPRPGGGGANCCRHGGDSGEAGRGGRRLLLPRPLPCCIKAREKTISKAGAELQQ